MANGSNKKKPLKSEDEDNLGYLSDESDFYGDTATKEYFNKQAAGFDAAAWWQNRVPLLSEIADANMATREGIKTIKQYNTYEGVPSARQLSETVDAFLQRLPPATTELSSDVDWIWIANPYIPRKSHDKVRQEDFRSEGPPDEESDLIKFCRLGEGLLQGFQDTKSAIEKEMHGKSRTRIDKAVNTKRGEIVDKIQQTAVDTRVTVGKWLLFPETENVNAYWARVARATAANELGIAAKVAPYQISRTRMPRLICVYTKDFKDKEDLGRVVKKLKDLDLVQKGKPIWYKPDAYTYLRIERDNEWGIKPSIHGSNEFLQPKNQKIDDILKRKYVDMED